MIRSTVLTTLVALALAITVACGGGGTPPKEYARVACGPDGLIGGDFDLTSIDDALLMRARWDRAPAPPNEYRALHNAMSTLLDVFIEFLEAVEATDDPDASTRENVRAVAEIGDLLEQTLDIIESAGEAVADMSPESRQVLEDAGCDLGALDDILADL